MDDAPAQILRAKPPASRGYESAPYLVQKRSTAFIRRLLSVVT